MKTTTAGSPQCEMAVSMQAAAKSYARHPSVHPLDLEVRCGETVALPGPNGAGKSTAIGMMLGLVLPDTGRVRVAGHTPRAAVAGGRIAAMLQDSGMMPGVRVAELVRFGERLYPNPLPCAEALEVAGLTSERSRRVDKLSGGQSQRLRFALAVVANPEILILDEPTRAMDVRGRAEFWETMRAFAAKSRTLLFASHYLDEVDNNAERVVLLASGRVIADDTPARIRTQTGVSVVQVFLTGSTDWIGRFDGVSDVQVRGDRVRIKTTAPDALVAAVVGGLQDWHGINVSPPSLDESFLALTGSAATVSAATAHSAAENTGTHTTISSRDDHLFSSS
ncbi:ABC transporter ATP-binding protein [Arthrobacter sp. H35-D1]|uniref:ABC transporter ATP-binding protein n=1 Tax=Arthrobacter sp. H35-D1 TaxID=3046202 RepID=UPI0024B89405|nr:ABC transporter ATP-binding protein [Arthrobacter sp. H35-D1]MDJ0312384.1 ABC transporter ATP-binding protein [Arthrobacter sp. H35-D1]